LVEAAQVLDLLTEIRSIADCFPRRRGTYLRIADAAFGVKK
jgi:hypothetical protein